LGSGVLWSGLVRSLVLGAGVLCQGLLAVRPGLARLLRLVRRAGS
jgi:hypothetical protein